MKERMKNASRMYGVSKNTASTHKNLSRRKDNTRIIKLNLSDFNILSQSDISEGKCLHKTALI